MATHRIALQPVVTLVGAGRFGMINLDEVFEGVLEVLDPHFATRAHAAVTTPVTSP